MNFLEAMTAARNGTEVSRAAWSGNKAKIGYGNGDLLWSSIDHPPQHFHPMCNDIFAEDWGAVQ